MSTPQHILTEKVFCELFYSTFDKVVRFITAIVKSEEVAIDLAQDTFAKIWERRDSIDMNNSLDGYVYVLAKNNALMHLRKERNQEIFLCETLHTQIHEETDDIYDMQEMLMLIRNCVKRMPDPRREIFILSRKRGMSNKDIADKLGIGVKTVEYHITKALSELKAKCFIEKK